MNPPGDSNPDNLAEAVERLARRQTELEQRVTQLEGRPAYRVVTPPPPPLEAAPPPLPPQVTPPPLPPQVTPPLLPPQVTPPPLPTQVTPPPLLPQVGQVPDLSKLDESTVGLNWVNRIAVVTLTLGAAFLFKYGVDNDWFGPAVRVGMGVIAALVSLAAGEFVSRRGQRIFGQGITGLGVALLYLSFYAAAALYHLIPQAMAFALMALTTVGAGQLALYYESQAIAALGLIGGYITPPALATGENHPWILFTYVFLLNTGGLWTAHLRKWKLLAPLAAAATVLLYAGWHNEWFDTSQRTVATVFAIAFYAQFSFGDARTVWPAAQILAPLGAAAIWHGDPGFLPLGLLFAAAGLATAELREWPEAPEWTLASYWVPLWMWSATDGSAPLPKFAWISAAFAVFFLWAPWWARIRSRALRLPDLFVLVAGPAAYFATSYRLFDSDYHAYMGLLAAAVGGLHLGLARVLPKSRLAVVALAVAFAFVTLAVPIQFAGFRITIAWALEGAALAWLASQFDSRWLDGGTWGVHMLVVLRLFSIDAWVYGLGSEFPALVNTRFLAFAVAAVSLWLSARFSRDNVAKAVAYIGGHVVMLWILGLEVTGAVERNAALADQNSVLTVAISVLIAVYAVMLVTLGIATRTVLNRILGLALVALIVVKLYLIDVWQLGRGFRIAAFLALGGLMLAVSYLYSRFRPSLERLLREDTAGSQRPA